MGKNDSALPKGAERSAGGPRPGCWWPWQRLPRPGSPAVPCSPRPGAGSDLPSGETAGTSDGEGERNQRGSGGEVTCQLLEPLSHQKPLSASPGTRCWPREDAEGRLSGTFSGRGPQKRWADPAGLLQRCVRTSSREGLQGKHRVP